MICNKINISNLRRIAAFMLLKTMYISACHATENAKFYMLMWTSSSQNPFTVMKMGRKSFIENECPFQNCYITSHVLQLSDITYFDVVLFNSEALRENPEFVPPNRRDINQIYVLVSTEPSARYQLPEKFNCFFNWTWTYRLDSDVSFAHIAIRDSVGRVIGPRKDMNWIPMSKMQPTSLSTSLKISMKGSAAAWYITNCDMVPLYSNYIERLTSELRKYYFTIDILGPCGNLPCGKNGRKNKCYALIESNYFFYLAFENVINEDYVSDQLLMGLNNYAVPVVFGGANYTRFMPDGIYLNALELGPVTLAKEMFEIISNKEVYHSMFKWRNHYTYHDPLESPDTNSLCAFCAQLNNDQKRKQKKAYKNIVKWLKENKKSSPAPENVLEVEFIDSIDKNKYEIVNGYDTLSHLDQKRPLDQRGPPCSSVMSCAGKYLKNIKNTVYNWFRIKLI